jgi:hypothetical protein
MSPKNFTSVLIICFLFGCSASGTCDKYSQKKYLETNIENNKLYNSGETSEAISKVEEIIKNDSNTMFR